MEDEYRYVIVETFYAFGESSRHEIRARPLPGQGLSTTMRVECSTSLREGFPVGTLFKIWARVKHTGQSPHLYSSYKWSADVVSGQDADFFIANKGWLRR